MKNVIISLLSLAFLFSVCTAPGFTSSAPTTSSLLPIATSSCVDPPATAPSLTATYIQRPIEAFITVAELVNMRGGPSMDFDITGQLSARQKYAVVG